MHLILQTVFDVVKEKLQWFRSFYSNLLSYLGHSYNLAFPSPVPIPVCLIPRIPGLHTSHFICLHILRHCRFMFYVLSFLLSSYTPSFPLLEVSLIGSYGYSAPCIWRLLYTLDKYLKCLHFQQLVTITETPWFVVGQLSKCYIQLLLYFYQKKKFKLNDLYFIYYFYF